MSEHDPWGSEDEAQPAIASAVTAVQPDIELAAASLMPLLISADPVASRAIAVELDRYATSGRGDVDVVDCRQAGVLGARLPAGRRAGHSVLLLQEVHALSRDDQTLLEQQLESELLQPPASRIRVVSSSSASLYDQVLEARFPERLYYLLNMIHIVVPPAPSAGGAHPPGN